MYVPKSQMITLRVATDSAAGQKFKNKFLEDKEKENP